MKDKRYIFNMDETGMGFKTSALVSRRKAIGSNQGKLLTTKLRTCHIDHVTLMCVMTASGNSFNSVVVFTGKKEHVKTVNGTHESYLQHLPPCYHLPERPCRCRQWNVLELAR